MMNYSLSHLVSEFSSNGPKSFSSAILEIDVDEQARSMLESITDSLSESYENVSQESVLNEIIALCLRFNDLTNKYKNWLLDSILNAFKQACNEINSADEENASDIRQTIELTSFSIFVLLKSIDLSSGSELVPQKSSKLAGATSSTTTNTTNTANKGKVWDAETQLGHIYDNFALFLSQSTQMIWPTSAERDSILAVIMKCCYFILENEVFTKMRPLKIKAFRVICLAVKNYAQTFGAQTVLVQYLQYYEHSAEVIAELLHLLRSQFDHSQLLDGVITELLSLHFSATDKKCPKSVATFLVRLSELSPHALLKHVTGLVSFLDTEAYVVRNGTVEAFTNLVFYLALDEEQAAVPANKDHLTQLIELLETRLLDINPYCRSKTLQSFVRICELPEKYPSLKHRLLDYTIELLRDKSSYVRRQSIRLLSKLIQTHPYSTLFGGTLQFTAWNQKCIELKKKLPATSTTTDFEEEPSMAEMDEQNKIRLTLQFFEDAIAYIKKIHSASSYAQSLLFSKNKSEAIEAMDLFVIEDAYELESSKYGIRQIPHLIWIKGSSDDGKAIQTSVLECFRKLFLQAPEQASSSEAANTISMNLINVVSEADNALKVSLEELIRRLYFEGFIDDSVVTSLWAFFEEPKTSSAQRNASTILLGMMANEKSEIIANNLANLLKIGLGPLGISDLILAKNTCQALRKLQKSSERGKLHVSGSSYLDVSHSIFQRISEFLSVYNPSEAWYSAADQAISVIYELCKSPDVVCSRLLQTKLCDTFSDQNQEKRVTNLSQLLFMSGTVAIKQIAHIEKYEANLKKAKSMNEKQEKTSEGADQDYDLMNSVGTLEDDFTESLLKIREIELLFSRQSILAYISLMSVEICANWQKYPNQELRSHAALALGKFMCVSAEFCSRYLPLFLQVLDFTDNEILKANLVIAFGDMLVTFNHIMNNYTSNMYKQLRDKSTFVRKTCLMTLTFLVLAGQIKIKGQLSEMAKCLIDDDQQIRNMAKLFFAELGAKENTIYNNFIDILSNLSIGNEPVTHENFKQIIKYIVSFIEKERHAKQIGEKLLVKGAQCDTERHWQDIAFTISLLPQKTEQMQAFCSAGYKKPTEDRLNYVEHSNSEQSSVEQASVEQPSVDQPNGEQLNVDQSHVDQSHADQSHADQSYAKQPNAEHHSNIEQSFADNDVEMAD